jgi:hypothetical protein
MLDEIAARSELPTQIKIRNGAQSCQQRIYERQKDKDQVNPIAAAVGLEVHEV